MTLVPYTYLPADEIIETPTMKLYRSLWRNAGNTPVFGMSELDPTFPHFYIGLQFAFGSFDLIRGVGSAVQPAPDIEFRYRTVNDPAGFTTSIHVWTPDNFPTIHICKPIVEIEVDGTGQSWIQPIGQTIFWRAVVTQNLT